MRTLHARLLQIADDWDSDRDRTLGIVEDAMKSWIHGDGSYGPEDGWWSPAPGSGIRSVIGIAVYGATLGSTTAGAALVDTLRIGSGIGSGTLGGWFSDGVRALPFAGYALRGLLIARAVATTRLRLVVVDPGGPLCSWVAIQTALRLTGVAHFATIAQLARAAGIAIDRGAGLAHGQLRELLRRLGVAYDELGGYEHVRGHGAVEDYLRATLSGLEDGAVVVFGARTYRTITSAGAASRHWGHALAARLNPITRALEIFDRPGAGASVPFRVAALAEIAARHGFGPRSLEFVELTHALVIRGARMLVEPAPGTMADHVVHSLALALDELPVWGWLTLEVHALLAPESSS